MPAVPACSILRHRRIVDREQPAPIRLLASRFRIPALPADLTTVRAGRVQDPFAMQHGEIARDVHTERVHVDGWLRGENAAIPFANGVGSVRRPLTARQNGAGLV